MKGWADSTDTLLAGAEPLSNWGPALRLLFGTLIVVVLLVSARRWLPALAPGAVSRLRGAPFAEVLGRQYLAPRKALLLVRVEGRVFMLSETGDGYRTLAELDTAPPSFQDSIERASSKEPA